MFGAFGMRMSISRCVCECVKKSKSALVGLSGVSLVGTGFGARRDFVDLWVVPDLETLERIGRSLCACTGAVQLRFYDSTCADEVLDFRNASSSC